MRLYHHDPEGFYRGTTEADESPLEPGHFLIPALALLEPPPEVDEGQRVRWTGDAWSVEPIPLPPSQPAPSPEEIEASRVTGLMAQIAAQEARQPRAMRELLLSETEAERIAALARLRTIETTIATLRAEI